MDPQILIVEDNAIVAEDLKLKLNKLGCRVTGIAYSGLEAIKHVQQKIPDIVLMDIRLGPGINGIETATLLMRDFKIPVIYLTAHADSDTLAKASATHPYGYIIKPFNDKELASTIENALHTLAADNARPNAKGSNAT